MNLIRTLGWGCLLALTFAGMPQAVSQDKYQLERDWLISRDGFEARIQLDRKSEQLILDNGLIRRRLRLAPNAATVGFDNLMTGENLLRGIKPEARLTIDGIDFDVGGLRGQANYAFLPNDLSSLTTDPQALQFVDYQMGEIEPRLGWKQVRALGLQRPWPPRGKHVSLQFRFPDLTPRQLAGRSQSSSLGRNVLIEDVFDSLDGWNLQTFADPQNRTVAYEQRAGQLLAPEHTACFLERSLPAETRLVETSFSIIADNSKSYGPGIALIFGDQVRKFNLRPGGGAYDQHPMLGSFDGTRENSQFGGRQRLEPGGQWHLRMRIGDDQIICEARHERQSWREIGRLPRPAGEPTAVRVGKTDAGGGDADHSPVGDISRVNFRRFLACSEIHAESLEPARRLADTLANVRVHLHYNLYDGIPLVCKWLEVENTGEREIRLNRFTSELLALVESESFVEHRPANRSRDRIDRRTPNVYVETDYAMGAMDADTANAYAVHWEVDPQYDTQVNYLRQTPCLLRVGLNIGPDQRITAGSRFESFRAFLMPLDGGGRERQGLARRQMYRTIAPWVQENPLMMHARFAEPDKVRRAIDQAADCGFEMVILTFGSGFNIEDEREAYRQQMKELADYAHRRGVELGGYSLLSSRRIGRGADNEPPADMPEAHGNSPSLTSDWGQQYIAKLKAFYRSTGFSLLEHDGPYPGDFDTTPRPPLQYGLDDSQFAQWKVASNFYAWLRSEGIYLNQPDWYFLKGANKTGMGYREVNWSLPRAQQRLHTRQNIFDGTWEKTPAMGWMFVPLTEYHGGGAAATIEPLHENLEHYEAMLASNLLLGVQACYRGPQLYDTEATRAAVKKWVALYKRHRAILESDLIHLRRADGQDLDFMLHVNPELKTKGLLAVFNPTERDLQKEVAVPLYYTGLTTTAMMRVLDGPAESIELDSRQRARVILNVPARGICWLTFE